MSITSGRTVCPSSALVDGGPGVRFKVPYEGVELPAFVVRFEGKVHGYLNRCMHVLFELDSGSSIFFDDDGRSLVCSAHGALYDPRDGVCTSGPCKYMQLTALKIEERDGQVYCLGSA